MANGLVRSDGRKRRRHDAHSQSTDELASRLAHVSLERLHVGQDAARPPQHALALRGESVKSLAALDDQDAEGVFEVLDSGRQRRLGDVAAGGRSGEVLLAGQRDQVLEMLDQHA